LVGEGGGEVRDGWVMREKLKRSSIVPFCPDCFFLNF